MFTCRAERDGDEYVINGEKWFSSNLRYAAFAIVMVVTDPDVSIYKGASMMLVPTDSPGVNILRNVGIAGERLGDGAHAYVRYDNVRVPADHVLGGEGQAFVIAQTRLGGGRIHHAMRTVGTCQRALDMMCERALVAHDAGLAARRQADRAAVRRRLVDRAPPVPAPGAARGVGVRSGWWATAPARRSRA